MFTNIGFNAINLPAEISESISARGWDFLTKIQAETIPLARKGFDFET